MCLTTEVTGRHDLSILENFIPFLFCGLFQLLFLEAAFSFFVCWYGVKCIFLFIYIKHCYKLRVSAMFLRVSAMLLICCRLGDRAGSLELDTWSFRSLSPESLSAFLVK